MTDSKQRQDGPDPYDIFTCSMDEHVSRDPTLSYSHGLSDAKDGRPIRGSSPEYEDGYLAGLPKSVAA